jgi:hypothetical protein
MESDAAFRQAFMERLEWALDTTQSLWWLWLLILIAIVVIGLSKEERSGDVTRMPGGGTRIVRTSMRKVSFGWFGTFVFLLLVLSGILALVR